MPEIPKIGGKGVKGFGSAASKTKGATKSTTPPKLGLPGGKKSSASPVTKALPGKAGAAASVGKKIKDSAQKAVGASKRVAKDPGGAAASLGGAAVGKAVGAAKTAVKTVSKETVKKGIQACIASTVCPIVAGVVLLIFFIAGVVSMLIGVSVLDWGDESDEYIARVQAGSGYSEINPTGGLVSCEGLALSRCSLTEAHMRAAVSYAVGGTGEKEYLVDNSLRVHIGGFPMWNETTGEFEESTVLGSNWNACQSAQSALTFLAAENESLSDELEVEGSACHTTTLGVAMWETVSDLSRALADSDGDDWVYVDGNIPVGAWIPEDQGFKTEDWRAVEQYGGELVRLVDNAGNSDGPFTYYGFQSVILPSVMRMTKSGGVVMPVYAKLKNNHRGYELCPGQYFGDQTDPARESLSAGNEKVRVTLMVFYNPCPKVGLKFCAGGNAPLFTVKEPEVPDPVQVITASISDSEPMELWLSHIDAQPLDPVGAHDLPELDPVPDLLSSATPPDIGFQAARYCPSMLTTDKFLSLRASAGSNPEAAARLEEAYASDPRLLTWNPASRYVCDGVTDGHDDSSELFCDLLPPVNASEDYPHFQPPPVGVLLEEMERNGIWGERFSLYGYEDFGTSIVALSAALSEPCVSSAFIAPTDRCEDLPLNFYLEGLSSDSQRPKVEQQLRIAAWAVYADLYGGESPRGCDKDWRLNQSYCGGQADTWLLSRTGIDLEDSEWVSETRRFEGVVRTCPALGRILSGRDLCRTIPTNGIVPLLESAGYHQPQMQAWTHSVNTSRLLHPTNFISNLVSPIVGQPLEVSPPDDSGSVGPPSLGGISPECLEVFYRETQNPPSKILTAEHESLRTISGWRSYLMHYCVADPVSVAITMVNNELARASNTGGDSVWSLRVVSAWRSDTSQRNLRSSNCWGASGSQQWEFPKFGYDPNRWLFPTRQAAIEYGRQNPVSVDPGLGPIVDTRLTVGGMQNLDWVDGLSVGSCSPPTAIPGRSRHQFGWAVDIQLRLTSGDGSYDNVSCRSAVQLWSRSVRPFFNAVGMKENEADRGGRECWHYSPDGS